MYLRYKDRAIVHLLVHFSNSHKTQAEVRRLTLNPGGRDSGAGDITGIPRCALTGRWSRERSYTPTQVF